MWTPYDWTRTDQEQFAARGHRQREPGRWAISTLAAGAVGAVVFVVALIGYIVAEAITGLADVLPDGLGALASVGLGLAAAVLTWRGIAARWHQIPPRPASRW